MYLDLVRELKKTMKHESDDCTNCDWCFWHSNWRIIKGAGRFGSWRTSGAHPNDSVIEDGQNTEKSHGDLRRLTVTQTPVKNHQLTLMWKTLKEYIMITILIIGVHWRTSLISSSLILQECTSCLARLIWLIYELRGKCYHKNCFVECCNQDLFKTARGNPCLFCKLFVEVQML